MQQSTTSEQTHYDSTFSHPVVVAVAVVAVATGHTAGRTKQK